MNFIKKHKWAFWVATLVGLIYIAPNLFFVLSLGDEYKGIPMMQTANEDFYLARMQEILDGHPMLGSFVFFEYKNQMPISPPTGEFFYAIPSFIFQTSPANILIASRFFLPFILFLLVYFLARFLTINKEFLSNKINSIATALFVTLGYDLIDFRTVLNYLKGISAPDDFLIWTRPVNPIVGAVFLMSFLIFLWLIIQKQETKRRKLYILGASVFLALMVVSYFFSWGLAVSVLGFLILIYFFKKEYKTVKSLLVVIGGAFLLTLPYWYNSWKASQGDWYQDSLLRSGLFYTHQPLFNKFMLAVLFVYLVIVILSQVKQKKLKKIFSHLENWHYFCLAFILGSLWVYIQQLFTGRTIWPFHFVQYTIPLGMIVLMVLFYNIVKKKSALLWKAGVFILISISLVFGLYTQITVYAKHYSYYLDLQKYVPLFEWLNQTQKDSVVFVKNQTETGYNLKELIPAFTHTNVYNSKWIFSIMPYSRVYHNYLVNLSLKGLTGQNIGQYISKNKNEVQNYLFSNWKELYRIPQFSDVPVEMEEKIGKISSDYEVFISEGLENQLQKYRLDYILIEGGVASHFANLVKELDLVYSLGNISVYEF